MFFVYVVSAAAVDENDCIPKVQSAVKRLNVLYLNSHLKPISPGTLYPSSLTYNPWRQAKLRRFWLGPDTSMDCIPESCQIVDFSRTDIVDNSPVVYQKPVATWTISHLISETKPWVEAALGNFPINSGVPRANFDYNFRDEKSYYHGEWRIRWPRIDSQGHPFEADGLAVTMSETYGLVGCTINFVSSFQEFQGKMISSEEALSIAAAPAQTLLDSRNLVGRHLPEGLKLGIPKADLFVANPNNIFNAKAWKSSPRN